eukprot:6597095-Lingulodinium_polyedra.AAC.1
MEVGEGSEIEENGVFAEVGRAMDLRSCPVEDGARVCGAQGVGGVASSTGVDYCGIPGGGA